MVASNQNECGGIADDIIFSHISKQESRHDIRRSPSEDGTHFIPTRLPDVEKNLPPRPSYSSSTLFKSLNKTVIMVGHRWGM